MPEKKTLERARRDRRQGKAATTQAGEFVREEMEHVKRGKHGVTSRKQAVAIGLSKARRAGVKLPRKARSARSKAGAKTAARKPAARRKKTAARKPAARRSTARAGTSRAARGKATRRTSKTTSRGASRRSGSAGRKPAARRKKSSGSRAKR